MSLLRPAAWGLVVLIAACSDPGRRKLGQTCAESSQCESGLCYEGQCVDPLGDEDEDGLWNQLEVDLGSSGILSDTDGDGIADPDELGADFALVDTDRDGKADIIESAIADADGDCIADQLDPDDATPAPNGCGVAATPFIAVGTGGKTVATARYRATLVMGQPALSSTTTSKHRALIGANPGLVPHPETP